MGPLKIVFGAVILAWPCAAASNPAPQWGGEVEEASARFAIPEAWIRRVMAVESGGRTMLAGQPIVSRAGAMGLMQLMPRTWREVRALLKLGTNPHDPRDNILAGTFYLRRMYDRFGYPGLFAAYNAGPARYAAYLAGRRALPAETRSYLASVTRDMPAARISVRSAAPLFAIQRANDPGGEEWVPPGAPATLFVRLRSPGAR